MKKRIGYPIFLICAVLLITYGNFFLFRSSIPQPKGVLNRDSFEANAIVDAKTLAKIGYLEHVKSGYFLSVPPAKPAGVIRIGCFGDSFTYGLEAPESYDYPSQLQRLFQADGKTQVQVINFGIRGTGLQQAYFLWESMKELYKLDIALFGPACLFIERDTSFCGGNPWFVCHSRYIIEDNALRLIDPVGANPLERVKKSRRFIPYYRYLRYERNTPLFLKALLPKSRDFVINPFYYYDGDIREELLILYSKLLGQVAKQSKQVVVLNKQQDIINAVNAIPEQNIKGVLLDHNFLERYAYLFISPESHYNAIGNRIIARCYYAALTGKENLTVETLNLSEVLTETQPDTVPLNKCEELAFSINNTVVSHLAVADPNLLDNIEAASRLEKNNIPGILFLKEKEKSIMVRRVVPLAEGFESAKELMLDLEINHEMIHFALSSVSTVGAGTFMRVAELTTLQFGIGYASFRFLSDEIRNNLQYGILEISPLDTLNSITLSLGNQIILEGRVMSIEPDSDDTVIYDIEFLTPQFPFYALVADTEVTMDLQALEPSGTMYMDVLTTDKRHYSFPFARWTKELHEFTLSGKSVMNPIQ